MWIRNQSKETLLKATKIFIHDNQVFASMEDGFDEMVGEYKSKERAIEVLDEIQERISPKFNYEGNNEETDLFIKTQILNSMIAVYQMPNE